MRGKMSIFIVILALCAALSAPASAARLYRSLFSFDISSGWTWEDTPDKAGFWLYGPNDEALLIGVEPGKGRSLKQAAEEEYKDCADLAQGPLTKLNDDCYMFMLNDPSFGKCRALIGRIKKNGAIFFVFSNVKFSAAADKLFHSVQPGK